MIHAKYEDCIPLSQLHSVQEDFSLYGDSNFGSDQLKKQPTKSSRSAVNLSEKDQEMLENLTPESLLAQARKYE